MTAQDLRIAFAGTPAFAASHLQALIDNNLSIVSAYSQPDRARGRGKTLTPSPVKVLAQTHNIPVFQPVSLSSQACLDELMEQELDVLVVVAYGLLLPEALLKIPKYGCLNVHPSLLPRWRGAAPIERAILNGDSHSGVCIMQMAKGLDTGDVLMESKIPISLNDNYASLTEKLIEMGSTSLLKVLNQLGSSELSPQVQDETLATYAAKLTKEEAQIDWSCSANEIQRQVNAFYPRSPAFSFYPPASNKDAVRIIRSSPVNIVSSHPPGTITEVDKSGITIACGSLALYVTELQLPGKKAMPFSVIRNGRPDLFIAGEQFLYQRPQSN